MNNVRNTRLKGMKTQIESWLVFIPEMQGYEQEDYNPLWELEGALEGALDQLWYIETNPDDPRLT